MDQPALPVLRWKFHDDQPRSADHHRVTAEWVDDLGYAYGGEAWTLSGDQIDRTSAAELAADVARYYVGKESDPVRYDWESSDRAAWHLALVFRGIRDLTVKLGAEQEARELEMQAYRAVGAL